jgi:hypothetical protein
LGARQDPQVWNELEAFAKDDRTIPGIHDDLCQLIGAEVFSQDLSFWSKVIGSVGDGRITPAYMAQRDLYLSEEPIDVSG